MTKQQISMIEETKFLGLSHSPSDHESRDGELGTCLNLICEDGALKPIHKPTVAESFSLPNGTCSIKMLHKVYHNGEVHSHYIVHCENGNPYSWYWTEKGGDGTKHHLDLSGFNVNAVTSIGNILCLVGDSKTIYAYWKENGYVVMDFTNLKYSGKITTVNTKQQYGTVAIDDTFETTSKNEEFDNDGNIAKEKFSSNMPSATAQKFFQAKDANLNKYMTEHSFKYVQFAVLAIRLYDGTWIQIGNPFLISASFKFDNTIFLHKATGKTKWTNEGAKTFTFMKDKTYALYAGQDLSEFELNISFPNLSQYEDIIDGVDVFVSNSIYPYKTTQMVYDESAETEDFKTDIVVNTEEYGNFPMEQLQKDLHFNLFGHTVVFAKYDFPPLTKDELYEKIDGLSFYKSTSYSFDEVKNGTTKKLNRILQTEETLELANLRRSSFGAKVATAYNNRLHLANVSSSNVMSSNGIVSNTTATVELITHAKFKSNGETNEVWSLENVPYPMDSIISFPSDNVTFFEVYAKIGNIYRHHVINLHKSDSFGFSYFVNYNDSKFYSNFTRTDGYISSSEYNEARNKVASFSPGNTRSTSLVKVSEAENPLVFPAKNSVQVGSSIINAITANTQPISEGQFGDAPLYAFTDEGVWMLMVGNEGTYQSRQPANREICTNTDGVLQIDDAVLFPTDRGIMLQRGRVSECITDVLDGYPFDFMRLYDSAYSKRILNINGFSQNLVKYVNFRTFLDNGTFKASMVYDYYDSRIILFNPAYSYAYVYSMKGNMWGTMENCFTQRVNAYPESYAIDNQNRIVNVYVKEPTENVNFFVCSRPLSLGKKDVHKTIFDVITRGYFRNTKNGKCGMVLYGSNDLFNWYPIGTSVNQYLRGLAGTPYKYFRIALIGSLEVDESISGISTDFQERWQNKLR